MALNWFAKDPPRNPDSVSRVEIFWAKGGCFLFHLFWENSCSQISRPESDNKNSKSEFTLSYKVQDLQQSASFTELLIV